MFPRASTTFVGPLWFKVSDKPVKLHLRRYATSAKPSARKTAANSEIPTPESIRRLRAKEHRWRKSIFGGVIVATALGYYLDGKYNARAIRRTLRTAWVGALLAVDYKWNFTYIPPESSS